MNEVYCSPEPEIVLVDDESIMLNSLAAILTRAGLPNVLALSDSRALIPHLARRTARVVVLDLQMPFVSGRELLDEMARNYPDVPVIVITAVDEIDMAVDCMRLGAFDYLVKPFEPRRFVASIRKALEMSAMRYEIITLRESLLNGQQQDRKVFGLFTTRSARMKAICGYLEAVAPMNQPVIITGETGVGKELAARAIHALSGRKGKLVTVNTGGLDDLMFSDTLFGHRKGAFTGADQPREGMIAQAEGGTLFLDEIGDMSPASQIKLLRLLQEGEYYPLGSDAVRLSNARIVVATHRVLDEMIDDGSFRRDLYYRLCAHEVQLPALRERAEDIPLLLDVFLEAAARSLGKKTPSYPPELVSCLCAYHFPGNIRELKGMVFDAMARHAGGMLSKAAFRTVVKKDAHRTGTAKPCGEAAEWLNTSARLPTLKEAEEILVREALRRANGNQGVAAAQLGICRQALNKRVNKKKPPG
ncbi:MAG TPA: sigma-54 dependent transcriptional regulator [Geobacteraceae bacterium]